MEPSEVCYSTPFRVESDEKDIIYVAITPTSYYDLHDLLDDGNSADYPTMLSLIPSELIEEGHSIFRVARNVNFRPGQLQNFLHDMGFEHRPELNRLVSPHFSEPSFEE